MLNIWLTSKRVFIIHAEAYPNVKTSTSFLNMPQSSNNFKKNHTSQYHINKYNIALFHFFYNSLLQTQSSSYETRRIASQQ